MLHGTIHEPVTVYVSYIKISHGGPVRRWAVPVPRKWERSTFPIKQHLALAVRSYTDDIIFPFLYPKIYTRGSVENKIK